MKFDRRITVSVILLGSTGLGFRPSAAEVLPPPSQSAPNDPGARWVRKGAPTAPLPTIPLAPPRPPGPASPPVAADPPDVTRAALAVEAPAADETPTAPEAPAAESGVSSVELEAIALANNPTIAQARARILAARAKCLQAGLYPNPSISYRGEEIGADGTAGQQGAFLRQEIVTAGKRRLHTAEVAHEIEQAEHAWQAQRKRVLNDVRAAWYDVLVAQRTVELHRQLVRIGQQGVKAAEELLAAKEVSRVDLLQARVEAESAVLQLSEAQNRHQALWRRLAAVLGVPDMRPIRLAGELKGDLPQLTWQPSLERLLTESPELAGARARVEGAQCAVARECAQRVPNLDVEAGVQYHHSAEDTVVGVEIGLPLPIFNRNQGNIAKVQADLIAAEKEVRRIELALQNRLAAVFERYANARHHAEKYQTQILPNAEASLDLVRSGYRQGEFDYLTLLTAQRTYTRVSLAYLESLREVQAGSVLIKGLLLTGGLREMIDD